MPRVILSMDVHCDSCAKKIRKAARKVTGVEDVSASFETGLVVVDGTAAAGKLRERLQAKLGKAVTVVSDGAEAGQAATGAGGSAADASPPHPHWPPPRAPEPAPGPPVVLEMDLHCDTCARKVENYVMGIPGVETVTAEVTAGRVVVTGTAAASTVATSLQVRTRKRVRVISDPGRPDLPGYEHERRNAAAARAAAERMQELYGEEQEEHEAAADSAAPSPPPRRPQRRRNREPAPAPPVQPEGSSDVPPYPPPGYGAPPPPGAYYYPAPGGEAYGVQQWAAPYPPPAGYYPEQGGEVYGQHWAAPYPPPEGYHPGQGGEVYGGQQWEAPSGQHHMYNGGQPYSTDENPNNCSVQ